MSHRVTSSPLFASSHVVSLWGGLGVPGSEIPTTGDSGGSPLANDGISSTAEYRLVTTTQPSSGTLTVYPDTSFSFSGAADGSYTWVFTAYENGVSYGAETVTLTVGVAGQTASPALDVNKGSWSPSSGADLYAMVAEATASDATYISASSATSCEMKLAPLSDPAVSTGHILRYRLLAGAGNVTVALKQGGTTITSWGPHALTGAAQDFTQTLTGTQADSITDYTDLRVVFTSS